MARVGERLRDERESRNTSLDDLSLASGIGRSYLAALEQGEIDALPGPAFGKLYIRAYAEVLGFDPQPWIDDYDRERRLMEGAAPEPATASTGPRPVAAAIAKWKESLRSEATEATEAPEAIEDVVEPAPGPDPVSEPIVEFVPEAVPEPVPEAAPEPEPVTQREPERVLAATPGAPAGPVATRRLGPVLVAFAVGLVFIAIYFVMRDPAPTTPPPLPGPTSAAAPAIVPAEPPPPVAVKPTPAPPQKAPPVVRESAPGALSVTESGTARRIVNGRLDGETSEFAEGDAVVFQTRVLGGARGEVVRHVWIYDGRAQQSISLRLGGPDFRTYSRKTLYKRGPWTVEARDRDGRVLAQAAFACVPAVR